MAEPEHSAEVYLERLSREMKTMRELLSKVVFYIGEAEKEVPEKMRRFMNYMHDLHDIKYMYEELGHVVPFHHLREMERCDDRFRQLIEEQNAEGGTFNKVRREMASDPLNRWDHIRHLPKPKENEVETRQSISESDERNEDGADVQGNQPDLRE